MGVDLDKWIEKVKKCEHLAEEELKALCDYVSVAVTQMRKSNLSVLAHSPLPSDMSSTPDE